MRSSCTDALHPVKAFQQQQAFLIRTNYLAHSHGTIERRTSSVRAEAPGSEPATSAMFGGRVAPASLTMAPTSTETVTKKEAKRQQRERRRQERAEGDKSQQRPPKRQGESLTEQEQQFQNFCNNQPSLQSLVSRVTELRELPHELSGSIEVGAAGAAETGQGAEPAPSDEQQDDQDKEGAQEAAPGSADASVPVAEATASMEEAAYAGPPPLPHQPARVDVTEADTQLAADVAPDQTPAPPGDAAAGVAVASTEVSDPAEADGGEAAEDLEEDESEVEEDEPLNGGLAPVAEGTGSERLVSMAVLGAAFVGLFGQKLGWPALEGAVSQVMPDARGYFLARVRTPQPQVRATAAIYIIALLGKHAPDSMTLAGAYDLVTACVTMLAGYARRMRPDNLKLLLDNLAKITNVDQDAARKLLKAVEGRQSLEGAQLAGAIELACASKQPPNVIRPLLSRAKTPNELPMFATKRIVTALTKYDRTQYRHDVIHLATKALEQPINMDQVPGTWSWLLLQVCRVRPQDLEVPAQLVGRYVALMESSTPSQAAHVLHGMASIRFQIRPEQGQRIAELALSSGQQVWNLPTLLCSALISCNDAASELFPSVVDRVLEGHAALQPQGCADVIRAHVLAGKPMNPDGLGVLLGQLTSYDPVPVKHIAAALRHVEQLPSRPEPAQVVRLANHVFASATGTRHTDKLMDALVAVTKMGFLSSIEPADLARVMNQIKDSQNALRREVYPRFLAGLTSIPPPLPVSAADVTVLVQQFTLRALLPYPSGPEHVAAVLEALETLPHQLTQEEIVALAGTVNNYAATRIQPQQILRILRSIQRLNLQPQDAGVQKLLQQYEELSPPESWTGNTSSAVSAEWPSYVLEGA